MKPDKIIIELPDGLSSGEEIAAIAAHLGKKLLPAGQKMIGAGYTLERMNTIIEVKRIPQEKPLITRECNMCGSIYEDQYKVRMYTNYGGKVRQFHVCSKECAEIAEATFDRVSRRKSKLPAFRFYR